MKRMTAIKATDRDSNYPTTMNLSPNFRLGMEAVRTGWSAWLPKLISDFFIGRHKNQDYQVFAMFLLVSATIGIAGYFTSNAFGGSEAYAVVVACFYGFAMVGLLYKWHFTLKLQPRDAVVPVIVRIHINPKTP